jgi:hypothetical protein
MRYRIWLLTSVSAISATAMATQAHAAPGPNVPDGYTFTLEGGIINASGEAIDKTGSGGSVNLGNNYGGEGAISIQKQIDSHWDIRGSIGVVRLQHNSGTAQFSGGGSGGSVFNALVGTDFSMETIDFDAGYTPTLDGNFKVRLFAGVRGLHYTDSVDKAGSSGGPFFELATSTNDFFGVGPHVGIEGSTRFGDSNFGISGSVAGAVIFGQNSNKFVEARGGPIFDASAGKTVYDLSGSLGLDYYLTDTSTLTVGYKGEELWNVRGGDSSLPVGSGSPPASTNQFLGTAFLKLKASY